MTPVRGVKFDGKPARIWIAVSETAKLKHKKNLRSIVFILRTRKKNTFNNELLFRCSDVLQTVQRQFVKFSSGAVEGYLSMVEGVNLTNPSPPVI